MQTIKPTPGYVFCSLPKAEKKTKSGILLTQEAQKRPDHAEVINVGDGVNNSKTNIQSGDKILYKSYSAIDISLNEEEFILVPAIDIIGVILEVE